MANQDFFSALTEGFKFGNTLAGILDTNRMKQKAQSIRQRLLKDPKISSDPINFSRAYTSELLKSGLIDPASATAVFTDLSRVAASQFQLQQLIGYTSSVKDLLNKTNAFENAKDPKTRLRIAKDVISLADRFDPDIRVKDISLDKKGNVVATVSRIGVDKDEKQVITPSKLRANMPALFADIASQFSPTAAIQALNILSANDRSTSTQQAILSKAKQRITDTELFTKLFKEADGDVQSALQAFVIAKGLGGGTNIKGITDAILKARGGSGKDNGEGTGFGKAIKDALKSLGDAIPAFGEFSISPETPGAIGSGKEGDFFSNFLDKLFPKPSGTKPTPREGTSPPKPAPRVGTPPPASRVQNRGAAPPFNAGKGRGIVSPEALKRRERLRGGSSDAASLEELFQLLNSPPLEGIASSSQPLFNLVGLGEQPATVASAARQPQQQTTLGDLFGSQQQPVAVSPAVSRQQADIPSSFERVLELIRNNPVTA